MIGRARKYPNLIIDLRGNPGGSVDTLKYLVGGVFDKEIKIADRGGPEGNQTGGGEEPAQSL
jgi:C-terminal processing protease CtpA/Prc